MSDAGSERGSLFGDEDPPHVVPEPHRSRASSAQPSSPQAEVTGGESTNASAVVVAGSKRRADGDLTQYADVVARHLKLRKEDHVELAKLSTLSDREHMLYHSAQLMKVQERLQVVQPANAVFEISHTLKNKIELFTYILVVSPCLFAYVKSRYPIKAVMLILETNPSWGLTEEVKRDVHMRKIVELRVGQRLADRRAGVKSAILASLGPEKIIELGLGSMLEPQPHLKGKPAIEALKLNILDLCVEIAEIYRIGQVRLAIEFCARVAWLRRKLVQKIQADKHVDGKYWNFVDEQLEKLRKDAKKDAKEISKAFLRALQLDQQLYGAVQQGDYETSATAGSDQHMADLAAEGKPLPVDFTFLSV